MASRLPPNLDWSRPLKDPAEGALPGEVYDPRRRVFYRTDARNPQGTNVKQMFYMFKMGDDDPASGFREVYGDVPPLPADVPIGVGLKCFMEMPKEWSGERKAAGERALIYPVEYNIRGLYDSTIDKLEGIVWTNSNQIVVTSAEVRWTRKPRIEVSVFALWDARDDGYQCPKQ